MKAFVASTLSVLLAVFVNTSAALCASTPPQPFRLMAGGTAKTIGDDGAVFDFGTLTLDPHHPIMHEFKLRNATDKPIVIGKIQPSCGCTTVTSDNGVAGKYAPVAPGQVLSIHVAVDTRDVSAGNMDKSVWIYLAGDTHAAVVLHVRGTAVSPVTFEPRQVDFKDVSAGTQRTMHIKMLLDPTVYGPQTPDLAASSTEVTVAPDGKAVSTAGRITRTYAVTLSRSAHLGPLRLNLYLPTENSTPFNSASIFVSANVIGDIKASPLEIAFGTLAGGQEGAQNITLRGVTPEDLTGLKVSSDDPGLHGEVTPGNVVSGQDGATDHGAAKSSAVLRVTLSTTVKGAYQSRVRLTTRSGQILELPVWAWIN